MPTVTVMSGKEREENLPRLLNLRAQDKNALSPSEKTTVSDKTCLLYGPWHYYKGCKILKKYPKKYSVQRPHKKIPLWQKKKLGKSVEFNYRVKEATIMEYDDTIPKKKKAKTS